MSDVQRLISEELIPKIYAIKKQTPILVGIDGVDGAGKSSFSHTLATALTKFPRTVVTASIDHFHNPAKIRYVKGKDSPEGFYFDSFNYDVVKAYLLEPFFKGKGHYRTMAFDCEKDELMQLEPKPVPNNSILIFEGIFSFRPELLPYWDLKIFLDVTFETSLQRNIQRSAPKGAEAVQKIKERWKQRYMPGQKIYFQHADPQAKADILIDNNDYKHPFRK